MVTFKLATGCVAATMEQQPTSDEPAPATIVKQEVNDSAIAHKLHLVLNCRSRRANKTLTKRITNRITHTKKPN